MTFAGMLRVETRNARIQGKQAMTDAEIIAHLRSENARLKRWVNDLQSGMFINCVYCGHQYGPDPGTPIAMADVLKEHIAKCPEHPLSHALAENTRLLAALKDYVNHLLVERPTSGLMAGKLTLWFLPGGDPTAEPSATQHPRYALSVESNSLDSASLGAIEAYQKAALAALTGAPDER